MNNILPSLKIGAMIQVDLPPNNGDIAFTSINDLGTQGELNSYVLKEYGYTIEDLPKQTDLINGTAYLQKNDLKPIIFVVTVSEEHTASNLEQNLSAAIISYQDRLIGKKLWIPLMGTGKGNLTIEESYRITIKVINNFSVELSLKTTLLLSIPNTEEGYSFYSYSINDRLSQDIQRRKIQNFNQNFQYDFYLLEENRNINSLKKSYINGLWERKVYPSTSKEIEIISKINVGDLIIVKSTHIASKQILFTKIKALGQIKEILNNKRTFKIEWFEKKLSIDIENIDFLRSNLEIQEVSKNNITELLLRIYRKNATIVDKILTIPNKEKIAGLISDSDDGIDYLEIEKDVNAFAKVIAAKSFEPPLAIALFGKWGSGKSFFMKKLKTKIVDLSENNNSYCEGIAQIHFNAWSYMDSNLWASIVVRIFEELNVYISDNANSEKEKNQIEEQLTNKLSITKDEIGALQNKKQIVKEQIQTLESTRKNLTEELEKKIRKVQTDTIWKALETANNEFNATEKISYALDQNDSYRKTSENLKKIIPEKYWKDPEKTYQLIQSRYTFLKEFFRKDKWLVNLSFLAGIIIFIIALPILLDLLKISIKNTNFLIPQATFSILITISVIWKRIENTYEQLQPFISKFWKIKEDYEGKIQETYSKFEQEEKVLKLEIEKGQSEILMIFEHIQKAESIKTDLEFRINNALATETLYSFIDKRSKANDYQKHLGIISIIRKDFEILSDLFLGHHKDFDKNKNNKDFESKFRKPLKRIILYIDDLDRCSEENVVQVLEAVNLLMAFPLFVVVVGVDSRWVKNALHKKHISQFDNSDKLIEILEVSNYLEKIFQIPFHLKDANDSNVKDMIKNLAQNTFEKSLKPLAENLTGNVENTSERKKQEEEEENLNASIDYPKDLVGEETTQQPEPINIPPQIDSIIEIENLILTDDEIQIMQDMSEIIGNNPRCIKRFVNIFRIIKAHEEFNYSNDSSNQEIIAILFLIALPLGKYKKLIPHFEDYLNNNVNNHRTLNQYLTDNNTTHPWSLKHSVDIILSNKQTFSILQNTEFSIFKKHNDFIRRFTFSQI